MIDEHYHKLVQIFHEYFVHQVHEIGRALVNLNDITVYSYRPYRVMKATLGMLDAQIFSWLYQDWRSIFEKTQAFFS
jgi:hypothetical protein